MEDKVILKKGVYNGFEWVLTLYSSDCARLEYEDLAWYGRILFDIVSAGGCSNYIFNKFNENENCENEVSYLHNKNGYDKHLDLGM